MVITVGKVKVSGAAFLAAAAVYFYESGAMLLAIAAAVAVHELGHYLALKIFGYKVTELKFELFGLSMSCDRGMPYVREIVTAASGPAASLLLALTVSLTGRHFNSQEAYLISGVSFIFGVFNLLPVMPLDGGKIVFAAAAFCLGLDKAERVSCCLSCIVIFALLTSGAALLIKTHINFSLLLIGLWLLFSYCKRSGLSVKSKGKIVGCV